MGESVSCDCDGGLVCRSFYLPRLFVYHTDAADKISLERFKVMERRLYYGITWPAALITTVLGIWLLSFMLPYYQKSVLSVLR